MGYKLNNFIDGKIFPKKNILAIMRDNKIDGEVISINYAFFKKIFIKIKKDNKISLLKLCLDGYSISLAKNEMNGYLYLNEINNSKFNLLDFKMIYCNSEYALSKIDFVNGKKGSYFDYKKFYNFNVKNDLDHIKLKDYINLINNRFNINDNQKTGQLINSLWKFGNYKIPLDISHGDFIHWNTIKTSEKNYVIDLEFFEKKRQYLFDSFHWFLTPIINKIITYNLNFLLTSTPCTIIFKILKINMENNYNKTTLENEKLFKVLFILFIFERFLTIDRVINLHNIDELIDEKEKSLSLKHHNILFNLLTKFIKDIIKNK